jgi:Holliday junction resolvase RusA-like endonuclease
MTDVTPVVVYVAGQPRGKGRGQFRRFKNFVSTYSPEPTVNYEAALRMAGETAMDGRPPLEGALSVFVEAVFIVPASWSAKKVTRALAGEIRPTGKPDFDNVLKIAGDGLNKLVWRDDAQITDMTAQKRYGRTPGLRIVVTPA